MEENNHTTQLLESHHTSLSSEKKAALWKSIEADIKITPLPSPFIFSFLTKKSMTSIALALVLMLGMGGTAYASNEARPGDLLFPVDQILEEVRLALASSDDARAELQITFAEERLAELRSILSENSRDNSVREMRTATTSMSSFEAEADVFTNTTLVEVEINDQKTIFETTADTKEEVISEIVRRFNVERTIVEQKLDFEVENRASRVSDIGESEDGSDDRIKTSMQLISSLIDDNGDDDSRSRFVAELMQTFGDDSDYRDRDDDDIEDGDSDDSDDRDDNDEDEVRFEKRDDDSRVKVRIDDDETRLEIRTSDDDSDDDMDDSRDDDDRSGSRDETEDDGLEDDSDDDNSDDREDSDDSSDDDSSDDDSDDDDKDE